MTRRRTMTLLLAGLAVFAVAGPARAQAPGDAVGEPDDRPSGALLFHGNDCGPGNRAPLPPVDALDWACMRHDSCWPDGGVPSCACNARLADDATRVARDPRQPDDLRSLAGTVAVGSQLLPCRPGR